MFTLRFYKTRPYSDSGESSESATTCDFVCARDFSTFTRPNGSISITINNVDYEVSDSDRHFDVCYVENPSGKTINVYRQQKDRGTKELSDKVA